MKRSFIGINDSSLFICVLSNQVIAFWTSLRVPGVACEDKYVFTTVPHLYVNRPLVIVVDNSSRGEGVGGGG